MTRFLVFTLAGPMMSFGDIAVGEVRSSWARPSKSAVLGLVGAALGLERADPVWPSLNGALLFAVRTDNPGRMITDYHTIQSAPSDRKKPFATRRDVLESDNVGTLISRRQYLCDARFTVLLAAREHCPFGLESIAQGLEHPRFTLYLGRKSCPLSLPPAPEIVEAETVSEAFAAHDRNREERGRGESPTGEQTIAFEPAFGPALLEGIGTYRRTTSRRDAITARDRWQFAPRVEIESTLPGRQS